MKAAFIRSLIVIVVCQVSFPVRALQPSDIPPIETLCVLARDDLRIGHSLFLGINSDGEATISELSPDLPRRVFGKEDVSKRLLYFFKPGGFAYDWFKNDFAAFCYELSPSQSKRASMFFGPVAEHISIVERGEFSNFTYNCTHYTEWVFEHVTKEHLPVRNYEKIGSLPTPRVLLAHIRTKSIPFENNDDPVGYFLGKEGVLELLRDLGLDVDLSKDAKKDWF